MILSADEISDLLQRQIAEQKPQKINRDLTRIDDVPVLLLGRDVLRADAERLEYQADPEKNAEEQRKELTAIEKKFITRYMLATTVKLLFFLVLLLVYAFTNRQDLLRFGLNFVVLYLSYSIFEVLMLKKPLLK